MLRYKNTKTGSLMEIPDNITISEVDDYAYLMKMMIYNDNRIVKQKMQGLVNCLEEIKQRRLGE